MFRYHDARNNIMVYNLLQHLLYSHPLLSRSTTLRYHHILNQINSNIIHFQSAISVIDNYLFSRHNVMVFFGSHPSHGHPHFCPATKLPHLYALIRIEIRSCLEVRKSFHQSHSVNSLIFALISRITNVIRVRIDKHNLEFYLMSEIRRAYSSD